MYPAPNVFSPMGNVKRKMNKWATGVAIVILIFGLLETIRMILLFYQFAKQETIYDIERTTLTIEWIMLVLWILVIVFFFLLSSNFISLSNLELRVSSQAKWAGILLMIAATLEIVNSFMFVETVFIKILFYFLPFIFYAGSFVLIVLTFKKLKELNLCDTNSKLQWLFGLTICMDLINNIMRTVNYSVEYQTVSGGLTIGIIGLMFFVLYIGFLAAALIKLGSDILTINEQPYVQQIVQPVQPVYPIYHVQPQLVQAVQPVQQEQYIGQVKTPDGKTIPIEKPENPADYRFCKHCGTKFHKSSKYCTSCGETV